MRNGSFKKNLLISALIATVLLAALVIVTWNGRTVTWFENVVGRVLTPVQSFAAKASNSISDFFRELFNTTDADLENERLRSELALYDRTRLELEELRLENERLRELMNYANALSMDDYVTAGVIGSSTDVWFDVFTLNAGSSQGVKLDMPVICAEGLIGRVTEVGATRCKVTAVIDPGVAVPVMIERTRDNCMVRGIFDASSGGRYIELYYMLSDGADLVPGDVLITSGIGGVYPKGIKVGTVAEVMRGNGIKDVNAIITPSVDFNHIEEAMILTGDASGSGTGTERSPGQDAGSGWEPNGAGVD